MEKSVAVAESLKDLANDGLLPISHKLKGLSGLFFQCQSSGREMDADELNGISGILAGLSSDIQGVYDDLHVILNK